MVEIFNILREVAAPNGELLPFECYNPTKYGQLPTAFQRRSIAVVQVGFPLYPESWP